MTLVVLAAGMGSRFGGEKQVTPLGPSGEILIDYSLYDAKLAGFDKVVFVIKPENCEDFIDIVGRRAEEQFEVSYVFQEIPSGRKKPFGTAHALLCAAGVVNEPFAVLNADDFYGRDAYIQLAHFLKSANGTHYCLIGYEITNTLSEHGGVSRGVCKVDESSHLLSIKEHTGIQQENTDILGCFEGKNHKLSADTPVSLNLWGFTPAVFAGLQQGFDAFLPTAGESGEFYLPGAVDMLIKNKECTVTVRPCSSSWYGVTYREDAPSVSDELQKLHLAGEYPPLR